MFKTRANPPPAHKMLFFKDFSWPLWEFPAKMASRSARSSQNAKAEICKMQKSLSQSDTPGYQTSPPHRKTPLPLTAQPLFDLAQIEASWGAADDEIYRTILGIFAPEAEALCTELAFLIGGDDLQHVQRIAHTLRGAASNVGAAQLASCALALEHAPESAAPGRLAELQAALQATLATIAEGGPAGHG